jgi:hypothetical protein
MRGSLYGYRLSFSRTATNMPRKKRRKKAKSLDPARPPRLAWASREFAHLGQLGNWAYCQTWLGYGKIRTFCVHVLFYFAYFYKYFLMLFFLLYKYFLYIFLYKKFKLIFISQMFLNASFFCYMHNERKQTVIREICLSLLSFFLF